MKNNGKKLAIGAVFAGVAGYLTGILTAPKSGKETRQDIKDASVKAKAEAEKKLKSLHSELNTIVAEAKVKVKKLSKKAQVEMNDSIKKAQQAKDKARVLLSSIHEGDGSDEDLHAAITEVTNATKHLKKFLGKQIAPTKEKQ